ncbi:MAG: bifunctional riboflavin kinase/FAD synthetase [Pseudomonadota bacterium]
MVTSEALIAAIGNFDGVHRGHQHLLAETAAFAKAHGAAPAALTFNPHPRRFFRPDDPPFLLTTPTMRDDLLRDHGAREVFVLTFDARLAAMSPEDFMLGVVKERLGLAGVVAGADFRFGKGRSGGIEALQTVGEAAGLKIRIAEVVSEDGAPEKYASSAVRAALKDGDVVAAERLLGRAWSVRGVVAEGQRLGRTIGFPTANLSLGDLVEPRRGVYATRALIDGAAHLAISNFGRRPTVEDAAPRLETHIFDFEGDLYGREIEVQFVGFIRDEQKFDGIEALQAQIAADCESAKQMLA